MLMKSYAVHGKYIHTHKDYIWKKVDLFSITRVKNGALYHDKAHLTFDPFQMSCHVKRNKSPAPPPRLNMIEKCHGRLRMA